MSILKRTVLVAGGVTVLSGTAGAQVLLEDFSNPFGGWTTRWFYQNATVDNYYVAEGDCDPNNRGNNECGLWFVDTQGCNTGTGGDVCEIRFNPGFAQTLLDIQFDVRAFVPQDISILDANGSVIATFNRIQNGQFPVCGGFRVRASSTTGIGAIRFDSTPYGGGQIEGNTAFDDMQVTVGAACYADCDSSTGPGVLDIFDFLCFQNRYDAGSPYACECDTTTGPGVCDIFDFLCFQNAYDAGCP